MAEAKRDPLVLFLDRLHEEAGTKSPRVVVAPRKTNLMRLKGTPEVPVALEQMDDLLAQLNAQVTESVTSKGQRAITVQFPPQRGKIGGVIIEMPEDLPTDTSLGTPELADLVSRVREAVSHSGSDHDRAAAAAQIESEFRSEVTRTHEQRISAIASIAFHTEEITRLRGELNANVAAARAAGATWVDIGTAAGITAQSAMRRWDPQAREKQTRYQRDRYRPASDDDVDG